MTVYLTDEAVFLEKGDRNNTVEVGNNNISIKLLDEIEMQNLWFKRDYSSLLAEQAKQRGLDLQETALIYGEINLPTYGEPLVTQQFFYNEQLGLTKEWPLVQR